MEVESMETMVLTASSSQRVPAALRGLPGFLAFSVQSLSLVYCSADVYLALSSQILFLTSCYVPDSILDVTCIVSKQNLILPLWHEQLHWSL